MGLRERLGRHDGTGTCSYSICRGGAGGVPRASQNLYYGAGGFCAICFGGARGYFSGYGVDARAARGVFALSGYWLAGVATYADFGLDFDLAEEGYAEDLGHLLAFAVAEDVYAALAVGAIEIAHVFYYAEDFYVYLAEHFYGFADVGYGYD
jgi:hypothetical protein